MYVCVRFVTDDASLFVSDATRRIEVISNIIADLDSMFPHVSASTLETLDDQSQLYW